MTASNKTLESLESLSSEVIEYIAFYLLLKDRESLSKVNKRFHAIFKAILATEKLYYAIERMSSSRANILIMFKDEQNINSTLNDPKLIGAHFTLRQLPWLSYTSPLTLALTKGDLQNVNQIISYIPSNYYSMALAQLTAWKKEMEKNPSKKSQYFSFFVTVEEKIKELENKNKESDIKPKKFD